MLGRFGRVPLPKAGDGAPTPATAVRYALSYAGGVRLELDASPSGAARIAVARIEEDRSVRLHRGRARIAN